MVRADRQHVRGWARVRPNDKRIVASQRGNIARKNAGQHVDLALLDGLNRPLRIGKMALHNFRRLIHSAKRVTVVDRKARGIAAAREHRVRLVTS